MEHTSLTDEQIAQSVARNTSYFQHSETCPYRASIFTRDCDCHVYYYALSALQRKANTS